MRNKIFKLFSIIVLIFTINLTTIDSTQAQCPMCKMSAEQNLKDGGTAGKGLNAGILYMLSTPYIIVAGLGFYWYKNRRREEKDQPGYPFSEN